MARKTYGFLLFVFLAFISQNVMSGGAGDTKSKSAAQPGKKTVINYYSWEPAEEKNPIIKEFMEKNPDIEVKLNMIPDNNDKMSKLDIMALGGGDIDVMPLADGDQFVRAKNGILAKLDDFIKKDGVDLKKNFGPYESWAKYGDSYYVYPMRATLNVVFYNKDMFDKAGVPYPKNDWTVADYVATAKKMTKGEGDTKIYGTYNHVWATEWAHFAVQKENYYTPDGMCNFDSPVFSEILKLRKELDDGGIQKSYAQIKASKTLANFEFLGGKAAMAIAAPWMLRDMKNKEKFPFNFKVGIVNLPRYDGSIKQNVMNINVSGLGIPATSKNKEAAWKFIRYYVERGSENIAKVGNVPVYLPSFSDSLSKYLVEGSGLTPEDVKVFFDPDVKVSTVKIFGAAAPQYSQTISEETELYFTGQKKLEDAVQAVKRKVNDEILKEKAKK